MRKHIALILLAAGTPVLFAFLQPTQQQQRGRILREHIVQAEREMDRLSSELASALSRTPNTKQLEHVRMLYEALRRSYKSVEPLIEYLDPSVVAQHVNGAPLPKLDATAQITTVIPPSGFQRLDEVLYAPSNEVFAQWSDTRVLAENLRTTLQGVGVQLRACSWTDRMLLEMCRCGVMRVMAMGITGFDRPASEVRFADDVVALRTVALVLMSFSASCSERGASEAYENAIRHCKGAMEVLEHASFATLDRALLIRNNLDPLYGAIASIHQSLELESAFEIGPQQPIVHPFAKSMFATDVLLPTAGSGVRVSDVTPQLVELGRLLFFDPILSESADRACTSCHRPNHAFTDGMPKSVAFGREGTINRNAPTLINASFARRFFYDLRALRMSDVIAHVITNEREFGSTLLNVVGRLRSCNEYTVLFANAFGGSGSEAIDPTNIGIAISGYLSTLVSFNSPVDRYLRGENVAISASVRRGFNLFHGSAACATCHFPPTYSGYVPPSFTESESEIIGVPRKKATKNAVPDTDPGRAAGILREHHEIFVGSFKTPTIRNIQLTAPYFHNGSYNTLEDVVDFYARGGGVGIGLHVPYQTLPFEKLKLSRRDRQDLIAFMNALTDTAGVNKPPTSLPRSTDQRLNQRTIGGEY